MVLSPAAEPAPQAAAGWDHARSYPETARSLPAPARMAPGRETASPRDWRRPGSKALPPQAAPVEIPDGSRRVPWWAARGPRPRVQPASPAALENEAPQPAERPESASRLRGWAWARPAARSSDRVE